MPERMNIVIDESLAKALREATLAKFGKFRGASQVVEEALRRYFKEEGIVVEKRKKRGAKTSLLRPLRSVLSAWVYEHEYLLFLRHINFARDQLITLTVGQLLDLVTQATHAAIEPHQARVEAVEATTAAQDEKTGRYGR